MLESRSGDLPGTVMFSEFSVVQFGCCMGCMSGNMERLGLKINFANAKLNEGFEGQTEKLPLL